MTTQTRQREVERLSRIFHDRVLSGRESLSLHEILSGNYPAFFAAYATHKAGKLFAAESPFELKPTSRYSCENGDIKESILHLKDAIIQETVFSRDEVFDLTGSAFQFQIDVLIQPRRKLLHILFKHAAQLLRADIVTILVGFDDRRRLISEYITSVHAGSEQKFARTDLDSLCKKTEAEIFKQTPISTFLSEVNSYLRFESCVRGKPHFFLRSEVVLAMLREVEIYNIYDAFSAEAKDKKIWTRAEIENCFGRRLLVGHHQNDDESQRSDSEVYKRLDPQRLTRRNLRQKKKKELESLQFNFLDQQAFNIDSPEPGAEQTTIPDNDQETINTCLTESIFYNDRQQFVDFIDRLQALPTWNLAKDEIEKELEQRHLSPFAKESILLRETVFTRYFSK